MIIFYICWLNKLCVLEFMNYSITSQRRPVSRVCLYRYTVNISTSSQMLSYPIQIQRKPKNMTWHQKYGIKVSVRI